MCTCLPQKNEPVRLAVCDLGFSLYIILILAFNFGLFQLNIEMKFLVAVLILNGQKPVLAAAEKTTCLTAIDCVLN